MTIDNPRARPGNGGARPGSGRPALESGRRVNLTLDETTIAQAQALGNGNLSAGVREAVRRATETAMNAILDSRGNVIGFTSADSREIDIAGAMTADGAPVNMQTYRVSKSAANRAKICAEMPSAVAHTHRSNTFYTLGAE